MVIAEGTWTPLSAYRVLKWSQGECLLVCLHVCFQRASSLYCVQLPSSICVSGKMNRNKRKQKELLASFSPGHEFFLLYELLVEVLDQVHPSKEEVCVKVDRQKERHMSDFCWIVPYIFG